MNNYDQLVSAYRQYLGREPEKGIIEWRLKQGTPISAQISDIANSSEANSYRNKKTSSQPLFDFAAQQKKDMDAMLQRQKQEQEGLFGEYQGAINNQEALPAMYKRLQEEAGIPALSEQANAFKSQIFNVKNLLDRLDEDVSSRTRGTMTSDAQRRRMISAEGDTLRTELGRLGTGMEPLADMLKGAQGEVSTLLQLGIQDQQQALKPLEMKINAISDRFAREMTGFTTTKESELTAILDKLERDRYLADRDWELAQKLAAEEREYSRQKAAATSTFGASLGSSSSATQAPSATSTPVRQLPSLPTSTPAPKQTTPAPTASNSIPTVKQLQQGNGFGWQRF